MLTEAIWARDRSVPTVKEYLETGYVTISLGITVLPTLYFLGEKLSDEIVQSSEYHKLCQLMGTHGRLANDTRSYKVDFSTFVSF